jgi:hypothetical protein
MRIDNATYAPIASLMAYANSLAILPELHQGNFNDRCPLETEAAFLCLRGSVHIHELRSHEQEASRITVRLGAVSHQ